MDNKKFLVIGATGHVGSKVAILLANKGYDVTAMVRKQGTTIQDPYTGIIKYVVGDLNDKASLQQAVKGMYVVISTANAVTPQSKTDTAASINKAAADVLISVCEKAGVKRFVQSSTPTFKYDKQVPELNGKRLIEKRLAQSNMQSIIIRNPAFMDVFLVLGGFQQVEDKSFHATTKREFGFAKWYRKFIGNLVINKGKFFAPGGAKHGSPMISTRDVAEMMVGGALYEGSENLLIEAGGPEYVTWQQVADIIGQKVGRKTKVITLPAWMARLNQILVKPFSKQAANTFALMRFVALFQPRWENKQDVIEKLHLPEQITVSEYINMNYKK